MITRREFAGAVAAFPLFSFRQAVYERRIYAEESLVPSAAMLERNGIALVRRSGQEFLLRFESLEARVRAWDRFNCDPEWDALREGEPVLMEEIRVSAELPGA